MKHTLTALVLAALALPALADAAKPAVNSSSVSGSVAEANSAGGALVISSPLLVQQTPEHTSADVRSTVSGTQTLRNVPSVSGPPLTSSNDTCMGSASGSANGPGFGLSLGKTYVDDNCQMLKNSRELWNMGMKAAAMALMCMDPRNREALTMTGYECPQDKKPEPGAVAQPQYTDPIVRARLGLPPLKQ